MKPLAIPYRRSVEGSLLVSPQFLIFPHNSLSQQQDFIIPPQSQSPAPPEGKSIRQSFSFNLSVVFFRTLGPFIICHDSLESSLCFFRDRYGSCLGGCELQPGRRRSRLLRSSQPHFVRLPHCRLVSCCGGFWVPVYTNNLA